MKWSLRLITGLIYACSSNVSPALMTSRNVLAWFLLLLTTHVATCWLLNASPSPGVPPRCQGAACDGCQHRQLAYHHARLGAQIVITTRRECMHYTRSVLSRMSLLQFVTCCALPLTHPSLFSTIFFLHETVCLDSWQPLLLFRHNINNTLNNNTLNTLVFWFHDSFFTTSG